MSLNVTVSPSLLAARPRRGLEQRLRAELEQQRDSLLEKLQAEEAELAQSPAVEGDDADRAAKTARQSKRIAMERLWRTVLADVERARQRLAEGTYGLCASCGAPIPEERLVAMPSAAFCIDCARRHSR